MILYVQNSFQDIVKIGKSMPFFEMHLIIICRLVKLQKKELFFGPNEFDGQSEA